MFRNWFSSARSRNNSRSGNRGATRQRQRLPRRRLGLETLEDRAVLSVLFVDGSNPADYSQIQDAVNAAQSGDVIKVASGDYAPFSVGTDGLTIEAANGASPVVDGTGSSATTGVEIDANDVVVRGLTVSNMNGSAAIGFDVAGNDNTLTDDTATNNQSIYGDKVSGFVVSGDYNMLTGNTSSSNTSKGWGDDAYGFEVLGDGNTLSGNTASNDTASGGGAYGIYATGINNTFKANVLNHEAQYGIFVHADGPNELIDNTSDGNFTGFQTVRIGASSDIPGNTLSGNVAKNGFYGFYIGSPGDKLTDNLAQHNRYGFSGGLQGQTYIGNQAVDNNYVGFEIYFAHGCLFTGNTAQNSGAGFALYYTTDAVLKGNTASGNVDGFYLHGSNNNTLMANSASNNGDVGFLVQGSGNTLQANSAVGNNGDGFRIEALRRGGFYVSYVSSDNNVLQGNMARGNSGDGFHLTGASNNTLRANHAQGNQGNGFEVETFTRTVYPYFGSPYTVTINSDNNLLASNGSNNNGGWGYLVDAVLSNMFQDDECQNDALGGSNQPDICN